MSAGNGSGVSCQLICPAIPGAAASIAATTSAIKRPGRGVRHDRAAGAEAHGRARADGGRVVVLGDAAEPIAKPSPRAAAAMACVGSQAIPWSRPTLRSAPVF